MEGGWRIRFATLRTSTGNRASRQRQHRATKRLLRFIAGTNRHRLLNWRMRFGGYALLMGDCGDQEEAKYLWYEAQALYEQAGVEAGVAERQSHIAFLMGR